MKAARGNVVHITSTGLMGVVLETDEENEAEGGEMNTFIRTYRDGEIDITAWYMDHEFTVIDDGSHQ